MASLIDTSLWIDFHRARSSPAAKQLVEPYIASPDAAIAEPIMFEMLRQASAAEVKLLRLQFSVMLVLPTPANLWTMAIEFGQVCRAAGVSAGAIDILICVIAASQDATIVTLDSDVERIGRACGVPVKLLQRPK